LTLRVGHRSQTVILKVTLSHCMLIKSRTAASLTQIYWHQCIQIRSGANYANNTRVQWNFYRVCQNHLLVVQLNLQSE